MKTNYLAAVLYFSPYLLLYCLGIGIEIVLSRRIRRKLVDDKSLRENGISTSGLLVTCREKGRITDITFSYEVQGKTYHQIQMIPKDTSDTAHEGDEVLVIYDREKPEKSLLKDIDSVYAGVVEARVLLLALIIVGATAILILLVILLTNLILFLWPQNFQ